MLIRHETIVLENEVLIVLSFTSIYHNTYVLQQEQARQIPPLLPSTV